MSQSPVIPKRLAYSASVARQWIDALASHIFQVRVDPKRKKQRKLPRAPRPRCGHPCALQRQVPEVQGVRVDSASASVHRRLLDIPGVQQGQVRGLMIHKTVVVPQLQSFVGRRHSFRAAEAHPRGPDYSADQKHAAVAVRFGGRSGLCIAVIAGYDIIALCFLFVHRPFFYRCRGPDGARLRPEVLQLQFIFKIIDFLVVAMRLFSCFADGRCPCCADTARFTL